MPLTPEERQALDALAAVVRKTREPQSGWTLHQRRDAWETQAREAPSPRDVTISEHDLGGVPAERVTVDASGPIVLFLHGGGYVSGSPRTHRHLAARIARELQGEVVAPDYRLAPEHPYPAAHEDVLTAWRALTVDASTRPLLAAADSAGCGLLLGLLLALGPDELRPDRVWLLCPHTDLTLRGASFERAREKDFVLNRAHLEEGAQAYRGDLPAEDPRISPIFADLSGLPPLLIQVGADDLLFDEGVELARRAAEAHVDVTLESLPQMPHAWYAFGPQLPTAERALKRGFRWLAGEARLSQADFD